MQTIDGGESRLVALQDGRVLAVGGAILPNYYSTVTQLYDPTTGQWALTGGYHQIHGQHSIVVLNDGKVLMAGGEPGGGGVFATAELYDPATGIWSLTGSMHQARSMAPIIKLLDGRVLIIGGATHPGTTNTTEIYDPANGQWTVAGNLQVPIEDGGGGDAVLLDDGRVLKVGGAGGFSSPATSAVAELFDPATGQWTQTGDLLAARYTTHLVKLQDGKVLMMAGNQWGQPLSDCEIYDPATGQWTATGSTNYTRADKAVLMPDGRVLAAGGDDTTGVTSEIYDPATGAWSLDAALNVGHHPTDIVALPNGNYLVAGGFLTTTAEVYGSPTQQTLTLNASSDTYVKDGQNDRNQGGDVFMRLRDNGNNRALVRFDQAALQSAVGNRTVLSAKLRLAIVDNNSNWGQSGRTVDVHRLLSNWAEGNGTDSSRGTGPGATWNCAIDINIANQAKDCSGATEWTMGQPSNVPAHPWVQTPTDTQTIVDGQAGIVEYDVTADVSAFIIGSATNNGWIVRKTLEGQTGSVSFGTRESTYVANLVVTYQ